MATQDEIIQVIADQLTLPPADVDPTAHIQDDLGLNPVERADLLHELSREFHIVFTAEDVTEVKTIGDLVELVEDKLLD